MPQHLMKHSQHFPLHSREGLQVNPECIAQVEYRCMGLRYDASCADDSQCLLQTRGLHSDLPA